MIKADLLKLIQTIAIEFDGNNPLDNEEAEWALLEIPAFPSVPANENELTEAHVRAYFESHYLGQ